MSERILIKFRASGDKKLQASLLKLAAAQAPLEGNTHKIERALKKLEVSFGNTRKGSRLLNNTFATLRSKMLLFSFAMSMGGRQLAQFTKQAANLGAMETAFTNLQGGTENAGIAMDKLREATDNTMSNFDLFQQANNAMILGITKNSDEMATMFDMAQRLGEALGKDTRHSVESLVTGIGRQSRLMLDNIGIIVDTEKAYKKYAVEIGVTADKLTDADKKQAFFNATMDAAEQKLKGIGPEVDTPIRAFSRFSASMENLGTSIGEDFLEASVPLLNMLSSIANALENVDFAQVTRHAGIFAAAIFTVTNSGRNAIKTLIAFKTSMIAFATGTKKATVAIAKFKRASLVFIALEAIVFGLEKTIGFFGGSSKKSFDGATESVNEYVVALAGIPNTVQDLTAEQTILNEKLASIRNSVPDIKVLKNEYESLTEKVGEGVFGFLNVPEDIENIHDFFDNKVTPALLQMLNIDKESLEVKSALEVINQKLLDIELQKAAQSASLIPNIQKEIDMLQLSQEFQGTQLAIEQAILKAKQDGLDFDEDALREALLNKEILKNSIEDDKQATLLAEKEKQDAKKKTEELNKNITNSLKGALISGMEDNDRFAKSFDRMLSDMERSMAANAILFGLKSLLGSATGLGFLKPEGGFLESVFDIFHQGGQVQGYSTGGMIPGYSAGGNVDNVPIMAQAGEFVMRRSAVESIGLENMNRMNRTGKAGGSVNVNFTGNVLSKQFIEREAIPAIRNAVRRGANLGVK